MSALHTPTCASGARAETRGECDCGAAAAPRPCRFRLLEQIEQCERGIPHRLVELAIETERGYARSRPLTTSEVLELSLALQELTRVEGERAAAADARRRAKGRA